MEKERSGKGKVRFKAAAACLLLMWCYESSDFFFSVDSSLNQTRQPEEILWLSEYFFCKNTSRKKAHLHKRKFFVMMCFVNKKTWQPDSSWTFSAFYQNISYIDRNSSNYLTCQSIHHHIYRTVSFYVSNRMVQECLDTFPSDEKVIILSKRSENHNFKI